MNTMTVGELRERLASMPDNVPIYVEIATDPAVVSHWLHEALGDFESDDYNLTQMMIREITDAVMESLACLNAHRGALVKTTKHLVHQRVRLTLKGIHEPDK